MSDEDNISEDYELESEIDENEEEELIDPEEEIIFDEELDDEDFNLVLQTDKYINDLMYISPDVLNKIVGNHKLSQIQLEEIKRLLEYRKLIVNVFGAKICEIPINMTNIIVNAKEIFKNEEKIKDDVDSVILKVRKFLDDDLPATYSLNLSKNNKYIYSIALMLLKIVIAEKLASKKIIGNMSHKELDFILNDIKSYVLRGILNPGEMIGVQCATSLSEPMTQMTLNTFHFAGISEKTKVNTGMKRIKQILNMSKTANVIDDVYCTIHFKNRDIANFEKITDIINRFNYLKFDIFVKSYQIVQDPQFFSGKSLFKDESMLNRKNIPTNLSILAIKLTFNPAIMFKYRISIFDLETKLLGKFSEIFIIHTSKLTFRVYFTTKNYDYNNVKLFINKLQDLDYIGYKGIEGVDLIDMKTIYRTADYKMQNIMKPVLIAKGTNFLEILKSQDINPYISTTNDIHENYKYLGINAAKNIIARELKNVYHANGQVPSNSMINLLVSICTSTGSLNPVNSIGIAQNNSSIIQQMTFEKIDQVLIKSAIYGKKENINGTSNNILLSQPFNGGTNSFKLVM